MKGTIITVCDTEGQAKKAVSDAEKGMLLY